jgi:hypothetical protein
MANTIKIKHSSTAGSTPNSLEAGEIALNSNDGVLFWENSSGTVESTPLKPRLGDLDDVSDNVPSPTSSYYALVYTPSVGWNSAGTIGNIQVGNTPIGGWPSGSVGDSLASKASATHSHGNINSSGAVGTTSGLPLVTGTGGVVQAGSFGTTAGTFCEGNDSRLTAGVSGPIVEGRLTLVSGIASPTGNQTGKGWLYFTPCFGNRISFYQPSTGTWKTREFSQVSISGAAAGFSKTAVANHDIFAYEDATGTVQLEAVQWSNDTTRATGIGFVSGVGTKNGDQGKTYLGTVRTTPVTLIVFTTATFDDSDSKRFVWNYFNKEKKYFRSKDNTGAHTYNSGSYRYYKGNTASGVGRCEFVLGMTSLVEYSVHAQMMYGYVGLGRNSVNVMSSMSVVHDGTRSNTGIRAGSTERLMTPIGYHAINLVQRGVAGWTCTFYIAAQNNCLWG